MNWSTLFNRFLVSVSLEIGRNRQSDFVFHCEHAMGGPATTHWITVFWNVYKSPSKPTIYDLFGPCWSSFLPSVTGAQILGSESRPEPNVHRGGPIWSIPWKKKNHKWSIRVNTIEPSNIFLALLICKTCPSREPRMLCQLCF